MPSIDTCIVQMFSPNLVPVQVLNFVQEFADLLPDYEVACEHEHSNCVLIAHKKVPASVPACVEVPALSYT